MSSVPDSGGQDSRRSRRHFGANEKYAAVHRILRGEEPNRVAAELHVSRERLQRWERIFLEGGRENLEKHQDHRGRFGLAGKARQLLTWGGLLLLLVVIVYAASRFLQQGTEP